MSGRSGGWIRGSVAFLTAIVALLRRLRVERAVALTLFLVVALTALVGAAIPRFYHQILDDELRYRVRQAPSSQRNISLTLHAQVSGTTESITNRMDAKGAAYQAGLSPRLQRLIDSRAYVIESPEFGISDLTDQTAVEFARVLRFRYQSEIDQHVELVAGRMPEPRDQVRVGDVAGPTYAGDPDATLPLFETALSVSTALALGLEPGDVVLITFSEGDAVVQAALHVSGLFSVDDAEAAYWFGDDSLSEPQLRLFGDLVVGAGLMAPGAYPALQDMTGESDWEYAWRYFVDTRQFDVGAYRDIAAEVRQLQVTLGPSSELWANPNALSLTTRIPELLDGFESQAQFALSIIGLATIGIGATALVALAVLAAAISERRLGLIALIRSRGATAHQLIGAQVVEGVLVCGPAAALGYLGAVVLIDARPNPWSLWLAMTVAALMILLLLFTAMTNIRVQLGRLVGRYERVIQGASLQRIALELLVVILASAGIIALRRRGLAPDPGSEGEAAFDPYLAAVPLLVSLAVGIATLRLYPLLMRMFAWLTRRRRGLVSFLSMRVISAQPASAHMPLLVMVLAVGIATFAAVIAHTVDQAQHDAAWRQVGADFRVEAQLTSLPAGLDLEGVQGIEQAAFAARLPDSLILPPAGAFGTSRTDGAAVTVFAVEMADYAAISAGTPAIPDIPDNVRDALVDDAVGTANAPIPVITSMAWPADAEPRLEAGALIRIEVHTPQAGNIPIHVQVAAIDEHFPGLDGQIPFVVLSLESLRAAIPPDRTLRPTTLFIAGSSLDVEDLDAALAAQAIPPEIAGIIERPRVSVDVLSQSDEYARLNSAPLVGGVATTFRLSIALGALYAGLAVITGMVLSAKSRARDLGYLRTLGLSSRQATGLIAIEQVPAVLIACTIGSGLGIAIAHLIAPGIDLNAFAGGGFPVALRVDWPASGIVIAGLATVVYIVILVFSAVSRRSQLGQVLRIDSP